MKSLFINELSSSFVLFIDHEICRNGSAFFNVLDEKIFPSNDSSFAGKTIYQSKYRQWIADEGLVSLGAVVPNYVHHGVINITKPSHGLKFDFNMGRFFLDSSYPSLQDNMTASFSAKEFNIYLTSKDETQLFLGDVEDSYSKNGLEPKLEPYSLIYIKNIFGENSPFAFGGMDECIFDFRCSIMTNSAFKIDAVNSILQDSARKSFPIIPVESIPFDVFGDIKPNCAPFNYLNMYSSFSNLAYIESVKVSKFSEKMNKQIKDGLWGGFIDFKINVLRHPRLKG